MRSRTIRSEAAQDGAIYVVSHVGIYYVSMARWSIGDVEFMVDRIDAVAIQAALRAGMNVNVPVRFDDEAQFGRLKVICETDSRTALSVQTPIAEAAVLTMILARDDARAVADLFDLVDSNETDSGESS